MPITHPTQWRPGTQQWILAEALVAAGLTPEISDPRELKRIRARARAAVDHRIGTEPLVFKGGTPYGPLSLDEQGRKCWYRLGEVSKAIRENGWNPAASSIADHDDVGCGGCDNGECCGACECCAVAEPAPTVADVHAESQAAAEEILHWIQKTLRPFCEARNADGQAFDQIGLRAAENAAKMLRQGISPAAIKHALTMHYPPEARRALGVDKFDPTTFEAREWGTVQTPSNVKAVDGTHRAMPYVQALAGAGLPIALVGPPGTGKTTLAGQLADALGVDFGMVSMTRGTSPSAFNGRPKIGSDGVDALVKALIANGRTNEALELAKGAAENADVITSQFERIFENGGVFLFDEMDAAEPNLLLTVNAALANGKFANPATGRIVHRHPDFVPVAGMNTLGLGGDRKMVGRERQDAAALDRWHAGRVQIDLDPKLEASIFWAIVSA